MRLDVLILCSYFDVLMKNSFTEPTEFLSTCVEISKECVTFFGMTELYVCMYVCLVIIHMSLRLLKNSSLTTNTLVVVHTVGLCILVVK